MPIAYLYWFLFMIWVIYALSEPVFEPQAPYRWRPLVSFVLIAAILFVLGWGVFGSPMK